MVFLDYIVMAICLLGMVAVGVFFGRLMKSSKDMFAAGGVSPWWVSGLSGFMTMFSANTFVVWGGIAFKHGVVAVLINLCYGVAAIIVGLFIAARWQRLGLVSVSDYIEARFGHTVVQLITWLKGVIGVFSLGVTVYAFSTIFSALIEIPEASGFAFLRDDETGRVSVLAVSMIMGGIVILYTMIGGLWAVLMTDVIQFIVLTAAVILVVPLCIAAGGGWAEISSRFPAGFLQPFAPDAGYTWLFLLGWIFIHVVLIGGDLQFAQRFSCVPTQRDARWSAFLFGGLYLISPFLWFIPPLIYRSMDPSANPEQAYILMVKAVLPVGLMGLVMAAMFSATASMVSSVLNVYAGVLTRDFYVGRFRPSATESEQVLVGRFSTVLLGGVMLFGAWLIPQYGVASYIISLTSLAFAPLLLPLIWGLFSSRIGQRDFIIVVSVSFAIALIFKWQIAPSGAWAGLPAAGFLSEWPPLRATAEWTKVNGHVFEIIIGNGVPLLLLVLLEVRAALAGTRSAGWDRIGVMISAKREAPVLPAVSRLPLQMCAGFMGALALLVAVLIPFAEEGRGTLLSFVLIMMAVGVAIWLVSLRSQRGVAPTGHTDNLVS
jgi:SSS family solute:Na+ symporter